MSLIQINKKVGAPHHRALFNLGFRPFFLGASLFSIVSIAAWTLVYFSHVSLPLRTLSSSQWHSHEMVYGYSMAVIAGFLLTAVTNWTGVQTLQGRPLKAVFILWLVARIALLFGMQFLEIAAAADLLFMTGLLYGVGSPLIRAKQWKQMGILSKVALLAVGNLCFYLGAFGLLEQGVNWGIYGGFYTIMALILTVGGRMFPGFIRNAVDYDVTIPNPPWITLASLVLFVSFFINQLFVHYQPALGFLSTLLFIITTVRLMLWHTRGIWKKPLLWSLYLSFVCIDIGFLLFALSAFSTVSVFLAVHAFAFGGIGMVTIAMMARVSLGHTGRSIRAPLPHTSLAFVVLSMGALFRVAFPLFAPAYYESWILLSQLAWISAFTLFCVSYSRILFQPRIDGQAG